VDARNGRFQAQILIFKEGALCVAPKRKAIEVTGEDSKRPRLTGQILPL